MKISRSLLEAKLKEATAVRDDLFGKLNNAIGAVNILNHLLEVEAITEPVPEPAKPAK